MFFRFKPPTPKTGSIRMMTSGGYHPAVDESDLPNKKELIASLAKMSSNIITDEQIAELSAEIPDAVRSDPYRSSHLWSKKSFDFQKRIADYKWGELPNFDFLNKFITGDLIGLVDSYISTSDHSSVRGYTSDWVYLKSRFELRAVSLLKFYIDSLNDFTLLLLCFCVIRAGIFNLKLNLWCLFCPEIYCRRERISQLLLKLTILVQGERLLSCT